MSGALQFAPFSSAIDSGFWYQLTQKKLDVFKLDDGPVDMHGFYLPGSANNLPPVFHVDYSALDEGGDVPSGACGVRGTLLNTNTLEDFRRADKRRLMRDMALQIWECIADGRALEDPSLLQRHLCLAFADLKKYVYVSWLCFPGLCWPRGLACDAVCQLGQRFTPAQVRGLESSLQGLAAHDRSAFLVHDLGEGGCTAHPLRDRGSLDGGQVLLGFTDPSSLAQHPGWPLRNLLAMAARTWGGCHWEVLCLRNKLEHSLVLRISTEIPPPPEEDCPECVGWELSQGKLAPRTVDMSNTMDPHRLCGDAVDLNLRLMRWRLSPGLRLDRVRDARCLLLGAGTLGCNVARCLMGWGVRHMTLVDNGHVSYSNPVRQSLFHFQDCLGGGQEKALAAARHLKDIFPGVEASGRVLSVPMPGHPVPEKMRAEVLGDAAELSSLVRDHDVLFLLTDTRESRWLPTLLAAHHNKLVLNAALGFDTFLVMRHGMRPEGEGGPHLGCYFCNDVVAPGNSTADRTLDQQCTVARPGLAYMAASMAVELMVSVMQHPLGGMCPSTGECELGLVPHQVRGYLDRFTNTLLVSQPFDKCTACSTRVLECWRSEGDAFLARVLTDPSHLEQVAGLTDLCAGLSQDEIIALSDEDSS